VNSSILHIENLSVGYASRPIIANFTLSIQAGELIGLKGRNGKGKTTLLKTICGLLPSISGNITFNAQRLEELSVLQRASIVSIVLTDRVRLGGITVKQLVDMGGFHNQNRFHFKQKNEMTDQCISLLKIEHISSKALSEISDGELQKAMIARALAQKTPIILMDEPTAYLDYVAREELLETLSEIVTKEKVSVFFSSHDIALMEKYCTRIVTIENSEGK